MQQAPQRRSQAREAGKGRYAVAVPKDRSPQTRLWLFPLLVGIGLVCLIPNGLREGGRLNQLVQKREALIVSNRNLKQKNEEIVREISRLKNDPLYLEEIARKEFGLVRPDEIIFFIEDSPSKEVSGNGDGIPHLSP